MALIKCPECGKEISSSVSKCPHCGFEIQGKKVTILGYTESFATSPSVTILKNGVEIGKVEQNGKLEIEIDQTCTLQFKCSMRSTECNVKPGDWVLLSFNRTTGSLTAILTDKDNYQFAINEAKGKDSKRWIWAIIIAVILFVIGYMLSACTTKTVQENTIESIEVAHEPIVPEEDISSYVPSDEFSVGMDMKIKFSPGNLQYCADSETWRFAENQYDMLGKYNEEISAFNEGWIDLFGWGTGDNPTVSSRDNYSYAHFSDWGENPISNVDNNITWRTLTHDEWLYLFHDRRNAVDHFGLGCVNGVNGINYSSR